MKKRFRCTECDAEYVLVWDLDTDYYEPVYCAFCAAEQADAEYSTEEDE